MLYKLFSGILKIVLLFVVPFILLIRGAVYLHCSSNYLPWVCIIGGVIMAITILFVYLLFIHQLFVRGGSAIPLRFRFLVSFLVVVLYVIHGIFYISGSNTKSPDLVKEVRQVHPVLRLAMSTLIMLDKELIITDGDRSPEDYRKMGLKSIKNSLHYKQSTGYSHAVDLRTKDRSELKNFMLQNYFRLTVFRTLRHTGTADHLHVSLLSHERPSARSYNMLSFRSDERTDISIDIVPNKYSSPYTGRQSSN